MLSDDDDVHTTHSPPGGGSSGAAEVSRQLPWTADYQTLPPNCARVSEQLSALHDGALDAATTEAVLEHIAGCGDCAARFEREIADVYQLIRVAPAVTHDAEIRAALYTRIALDGYKNTASKATHAREIAPQVPILSAAVEDTMWEDTMSENTADTDSTTVDQYRTTSDALPLHASRSKRAHRIGRWLTTLAAVLVVALIAGTLLTRIGGQQVAGNVTATTTAPGGTQGGPCTPKQTKVNLPDRATIFAITMTSPTEGWLVGAIFTSDFRTTQSGMILHFSQCHWQPVQDPLPNAFLDSISMVSPTEGWVTGFTSSDTNYLLHYSQGHWRQVSVPYHATDGSTFGGIKMLSADEGWLVVNSKSSFQPPIFSLLLHYQHGTWTQVTVPIPTVWDFAPVGPGELWLVGNSSTSDRKDSSLAHYRAGQWTTTPAPNHVLLNTLVMQSPTDGYAVGWQPQPDQWNQSSQPPAAALKFDGTSWTPLQIGADVAAQTVILLSKSDGWAFVQPPNGGSLPNAPITTVQHEVSGHWQNVSWPFTDVIAIGPMVRVSSDEYWAAAFYQTPPGSNPGDFRWELLHYVQGTWTAYGHQ